MQKCLGQCLGVLPSKHGQPHLGKMWWGAYLWLFLGVMPHVWEDMPSTEDCATRPTDGHEPKKPKSKGNWGIQASSYLQAVSSIQMCNIFVFDGWHCIPILVFASMWM